MMKMWIMEASELSSNSNNKGSYDWPDNSWAVYIGQRGLGFAAAFMQNETFVLILQPLPLASE